MKRLLIFLLLLAGLSQCTKSDTAPSGYTIFDNPTDPDLLIDTIIDADKLGTGDCFVFKYDNLNRVTVADYYEYLSFQPINHDRISTFHYTGTDLLPTSVDVDWGSTSGYGYGHYKIYFFYNSDRSKNRDSIIDLLDNNRKSIRRYEYGPGLSYVKTRYYVNGNPVYSYGDSASFNNYNGAFYLSNSFKAMYGLPSVTDTYVSEAFQFDDKVNPVTRLNIMPAMFMNNCLHYGYFTDDLLSTSSLAFDFTYQNNPTRTNVTHYSSYGGGTNRRSRTCYSVKYDAKNRISEKKSVDSLFQGSNYIDFNTITYKYHN